MDTINERMKYLRKTLKLKQREFAEPLGLTQQAITNFERNYKINDYVIKSVCKEFKVNEKWLRTGEGEMFDETSKKVALDELAEEYSLTLPEKNFIEKYLNLPVDKRILLSEVNMII